MGQAIVRIKRISPRRRKTIDLAAIIAVEKPKEAQAIKRDFEATVATWVRKPEFVIENTQYGANIYTTDKIYGYVSGGTRPHVIAAKNAPTLAFNTSGFAPKTAPRIIGSKAGHAAGPPPAFPQQVQHPGTEAREFEKTIQKRSEKRYAQNVRHAIALENRKG